MSFVGCSNDEFVKDYKEYKELYVKVVNEVVPNDSDYAIEKLNDELITEKLDQMKKIVERMNTSASTKREKQMLSNTIQFNKGLEFLKYAANNKDKLTEVERGKITGEVLMAEIYRKGIQDGDY
jgi:hypothetical protein